MPTGRDLVVTTILVATLAIPVLIIGGCVGFGYEPQRPPIYAEAEVLRAQVQELERRAAEAEAAACPNLGSYPVPPPCRSR